MIERYTRERMKKVWDEEYKFKKWLDVEIAVCEAWAEVGGIPTEAIPRIKEARVDTGRIKEILRVTHHDMTAFLRAVAETIGEESRFIHMGLTSSDVMDTALSLQMREASDILLEDIDEVIGILRDKAIEHKDTIMMGRTHGVHAEPITFGLKLAIWYEEMRRNRRRLEDAREEISYGKISGAVGTHATVPIEVEEIALSKLGLKRDPVSSQIIQRDRHARFLTTLAIIASSLEKFATDIRGLQRTEILEVEEPFEEGQTGSSAMPHKKNPELCERICGLARLIRANSMVSLENIALWHERDISHSSAERIIIPDSCIALDYMLHLFSYIMRGLKVNRERMAQNIEITRGLIFSQRVLLSLIDKGLPRDRAYGIVQRNALAAWEKGIPFLDLLLEDGEVLSYISEDELRSLFDVGFFTREIDKIFERMGLT